MRESQVLDMPEPTTVRHDLQDAVADCLDQGVEPPARKVPHPYRPVRSGGEEPQGGAEPTRVADRDGIESFVEGKDDAGAAAVSAGRIALGGIAGGAAGSRVGVGLHADRVDRFHSPGRKRVCGGGSGDGGGGLC